MYTDEEIMAMVKESGFWGGVEWRSHTAPYFRKFLELADASRISKRYKHDPDKYSGGKPLGEIE